MEVKKDFFLRIEGFFQKKLVQIGKFLLISPNIPFNTYNSILFKPTFSFANDQLSSNPKISISPFSTFSHEIKG